MRSIGFAVLHMVQAFIPAWHRHGLVGWSFASLGCWKRHNDPSKSNTAMKVLRGKGWLDD